MLSLQLSNPTEGPWNEPLTFGRRIGDFLVLTCVVAEPRLSVRSLRRDGSFPQRVDVSVVRSGSSLPGPSRGVLSLWIILRSRGLASVAARRSRGIGWVSRLPGYAPSPQRVGRGQVADIRRSAGAGVHSGYVVGETVRAQKARQAFDKGAFRGSLSPPNPAIIVRERRHSLAARIEACPDILHASCA